MAPTVSGLQNEVDQPLVPAANQARPSTIFVKSVRRAHDIHQRSQPKLWRRQYPGTHPFTNLSDPAPPPNGDAFVPYTPSIALHANIIPHATSPANTSAAGSSLTSGRLPVTGIVLILGGAFIAAVLGLAGIFMMRSLLTRKGLQILQCCRRRQKAKKEVNASENKGVLVVSDEFDDPSWGTPTRIVYVESIGDHDPPGPTPPLDSSPTVPFMSTWSTHGQRGSPPVCERDIFQERLHVEENDITLALNLALRDIATQPEEGNASTLESLQTSTDKLGKSISSLVTQNRPRQGSDASASSQATTCPNVVDCFSVASSRSSMTSFESIEIDSDLEEDELEIVYEVKHAQAQSVEIKKGVLVACRPSTATSEESLNLDILPTVVVSEPSRLLLSLEDRTSRGTIYSLESPSSTVSLRECNTAPSISSLIRENSRGTLCSLSTSFSTTTRTDGWCTDDEGFLQPPIPHLIVTRPSDSSIYTTESSASSVSVDLNEFPLPPKPVKPSYYSRLMGQVHARKRVWDNHPADSTIVQRRSTVEQFIMMYSGT